MTTSKNNIKKAGAINPEQFYSVKEALGFGVMSASSFNTQRQMLLRHIREGRIEGKNLGGDKKPRYVIQGKHLIAYRDAQMKPGDYEKK